MVFHNFDELIAKVKGEPQKKIMAVACANDDHTLEAVVHARREGIIEPILVGDKKIITGILAELKEEIP
ncbi:MAG: phosphate butyryltransferase, partial [Pseudobutyrivibrio sp.]|nr:phosphate butyryltransferase [Pseudobutyrivibrio sp.]